MKLSADGPSPWVKRYPRYPSWYAACYAMLLRSQGVDRDEVRRRVLERFAGYREVHDQLAPKMPRIHACAD
jgi:hypothetical protein